MREMFLVHLHLATAWFACSFHLPQAQGRYGSSGRGGIGAPQKGVLSSSTRNGRLWSSAGDESGKVGRGGTAPAEAGAAPGAGAAATAAVVEADEEESGRSQVQRATRTLLGGALDDGIDLADREAHLSSSRFIAQLEEEEEEEGEEEQQDKYPEPEPESRRSTTSSSSSSDFDVAASLAQNFPSLREFMGDVLQREDDVVAMALGNNNINPFIPGSFSSQYVYALQQLISDTDEDFGAAFLSLRSSGSKAAIRTWKLGKPSATKLLALHRFKLWWMKPLHADATDEIPPETQLVIAEMPPDEKTGKVMYALYVPLIDGSVKCSLKGMPDQSLHIIAETGCSETSVPPSDVAGLFVGVHSDPFVLIDKSFKLIQNRLKHQVRGRAFSSGLLRGAEKELLKRKKQEVVKTTKDESSPDFSNHLGWCTWDSFYTGVDHDKMFRGLDSLKASGSRPKWLVLDDGWQSTSNPEAPNGEQWMDHLTSLRANEKFRDNEKGYDLKRTVSKAKGEYDIDYFLVWHAIAGYWAGVDLDSPDLEAYEPVRASLKAPPGIVQVDPEMKMFFLVCRFLNKRFGVVPAKHIRAFYDDYHQYLAEQGVDGVKVDAQSVLNFVGNGQGGSVSLTRSVHNALSRSVKKHFRDTDGPLGAGGRIIHCMNHDNEILLQLPSCYERRPVVRGSDDFYPRDAASHGVHIYANAFNSLLISNCGLQDWDMFQTTLGTVSWMHAASRAISGGPVYISDRPGEHDVELLKRIVLDDGSVLRPLQNALPTLKSLFSDPQQPGGGLLSIWTENPAAGHGVVGMFNIAGSAWNQRLRKYAFVNKLTYDKDSLDAKDEEKGTVCPRDCHVLVKEREGSSSSSSSSSRTRQFVTYLFEQKTLSLGGLDDALPISLGTHRYELAAMSEVNRVGQVKWASVGLADMFNAGGAVVSEQLKATAEGGTAQVSVKVKGSGRFLAYCSHTPHHVSLDGKDVKHSYSVDETSGLGTLQVQIPQPYEGTPRDIRVEWEDCTTPSDIIDFAEM